MSRNKREGHYMDRLKGHRTHYFARHGTNNLTGFAKDILASLYEAGAHVGEPYNSDLSTIARQVGLAEGYLSLVKNALHELVKKDVSVAKDGRHFMTSYITKLELIGEDQVSIILGVSKELAGFN